MSSDNNSPRKTGWFASVLLLLVSVVTVFLLSEGAVRVLAPQQPMILRGDIWHPVDSLGWSHRPNVATTINTGEGTVQVFTDHRGYRVSSSGPVEAERSVLLLGDSFMAALQVEYEDSVAGLMEDGLREALGEPVAVRNTGVGAWDPPHYLIKIRRALDRNPADAVLVAVYLGNDVVAEPVDIFNPRHPTPRPRFSIPWSISPADWLVGVAAPIDFQLRQISHLYLLARSQLVEARMRLGLSSIYFPEEYLASEADSERWDVTANILEDIAREAAARDTPILFFLIPSHFQVIAADLDRHIRAFQLDTMNIRIDQPNELLGTRMRERGLPVLDVTFALRRAAAEGYRPYGQVDTHFNEIGHRVTWEAIREEVLQILEIPLP